MLTVGTIGVQLLLLLGAIYSLALGYNYRYILLELAKLEVFLRVKDVILVGWPRSRQDFLDRYTLPFKIPWCTPPEIIKVFWWAFLFGIAGVTMAAYYYYIEKPNALWLWPVIFTGVISFLTGLILPIRFGFKLRKLCNREPETWDFWTIPNSVAGPEQ